MKLIALLFIFAHVFILGQDYGNNYYPLSVGNKWFYESSGHWTEIVDSAIWVYTWKSPLSVEVVDTVLSNEKIFELLITRENIFSNRIEAMTWYETFYKECEVFSSFSLMFLFNDYEKRFDLCSAPGDSTQFKFFDYQFNNQAVTLYHITDSTYNLFGESITAQIFQKTTEKEFYNVELAQGFGLTEQHGGTTDYDWASHLTLRGAVIDGVIYGDTSIIISVEDEENIPNNFNISQNYPNPFNPTTKIKFTLPNVGDENFRPLQTQLIVYDILGREIKTVLNKLMQPGEYEIDFDATGLPSGVYFYRLSSGSFVQTKKMVLIR